MNKIEKIFKTETAHIVREALSNRCKYNIHGHSYFFHVIFSSHKLNNAGMVIDFKGLKEIKDFIDKFDHATVLWGEEKRDIVDFFLYNFKRVVIMKQNPTAENMARLIFKFCFDWGVERKLNIEEVKVWETDTGCGIFTLSGCVNDLKNDIILMEKIEE